MKYSITKEPRHECICEHNSADQMRGDRTADQCLCFRLKDTLSQLSKSEISSLLPYFVLVQPGCVGPGRKPVDRFFFFDAVHIVFSDQDVSWSNSVYCICTIF